ncbi:MAG: binding domain of 6-phosphogluconate dehydrogenase, partial [bacterium]
MTQIAFVGVGELACSLAGGMSAAGAEAIAGWSRPRSDPAAAQATRDRAAAAGIPMRATLEEAVAGAQLVIAAVPAGAALEVARAAAGHVAPGCVYVD